MNSHWKQKILTAYRVEKKTIDQICKETGYREGEVNKVLFPTDRPRVTEAIIAKKPLPPTPVKKGYTIMEGKPPKEEKVKSPKMVEAGKKAHLKKLENLAKKQRDERAGSTINIPIEIPPKTKLESHSQPVSPIEKKAPIFNIDDNVEIPISHSIPRNRKERRKSLQKDRTRFTYRPIPPKEVVNNTIETVIKEAKKEDAIIPTNDRDPILPLLLEQDRIIANLLSQAGNLLLEVSRLIKRNT